MSDADQVTTHYVFESTRGTTPSNPAFRRLRVTTPELQLESEHVESAELNAHRQETDHPLIGINTGGQIGLELSYGNADDWIEAAMCGAWARKANGTITACTTTTFDVTNSSNFKKGMVVRVAGMATAGNNGIFVLASNGTGSQVAQTGLVAEASAPPGATMTCIGFQCASGEGSVTNVGGQMRITITSTSGDFSALGLTAGEWLKIGGTLTANQYATAATNGWGRLAANGVTATTLTFDIAPPGWAADTATSKTIRLTFGDRLVPGTTRRFATVQNRANDASPVIYTNTRGQEAGTLAFGFEPRDMAKATLTLMGDDGDYNGAIAGQTDVAAPTNDVMNTGADLGRMSIDGTPAGSSGDDFVQRINLTLDNRLRNRPALGRRGYAGRGLGKLQVRGDMAVYLGNSNAQLVKTLLNQDFQADWRLADAAGRTLLFDLPAFKWGAGVRVGGTGQDAVIQGMIKARRHVTFGYPLLIQRYSEVL